MDYYLVGKKDPLLAVYVVEGVYALCSRRSMVIWRFRFQMK